MSMNSYFQISAFNLDRPLLQSPEIVITTTLRCNLLKSGGYRSRTDDPLRARQVL